MISYEEQTKRAVTLIETAQETAFWGRLTFHFKEGNVSHVTQEQVVKLEQMNASHEGSALSQGKR